MKVSGFRGIYEGSTGSYLFWLRGGGGPGF